MADIATKKISDKSLPANKQKGEKICSCCGEKKSLVNGFYASANPLYSSDKRVPICKMCIRDLCINSDTGEIEEVKLNNVLRSIQKPYFKDDLASAYSQFAKEHSYIDESDVKKYGEKVLGLYFKNTMLRQNRDLSYDDSEAQQFMHQTSNISISEKQKIMNKYSDIQSEKQSEKNFLKSDTIYDALIYSDEWLGDYSEKDIACLDKYYRGLDRDYKIITENHRDYARKIAKASLQMDKCFNDMINSVVGADVKYKNAREAFDTLSKSAKFSESTRSVNDVGISSFSKITEMVENHNWIPEHKPIEKDDMDKLLDYLSTITKSL